MVRARRPLKRARLRAACCLTLILPLALGCAAGDEEQSPPAAIPTATARSTPPVPTLTTPIRSRPATEPAPPVRFDADAALDIIQFLAGELGPRETTSAAYARAADAVERHLRRLGYQVRRQRLPVPAGVSWGVPVPAGRTHNVIATMPGFDPSSRHLIVGAQLDTVPQAPGAVDNASGVALLLEAARLAAAQPPRAPVVFVAFAAEEPRGPGDNLHHFGSRAYVAAMGPAERHALIGMISVDAVGIAREVPVCTGGRGHRTLANAILARATDVGIPAIRCTNRTSDHWSFERAGLAGARIGRAGAAAYKEYHSPADRPGIIDRVALDRAGRLLWEAVRTIR